MRKILPGGNSCASIINSPSLKNIDLLISFPRTKFYTKNLTFVEIFFSFESKYSISRSKKEKKNCSVLHQAIRVAAVASSATHRVSIEYDSSCSTQVIL